ncbi:MAG: MBL fold metallo-hydrolase [Clostridia bacterium]|nr:MBL fold metallo-hydrolase [Clostridia bacterium]
MKKIFKTTLPIFLAILLLAGGAGLWVWQSAQIAKLTEGKLQLHFIDVGQGDAALLVLPTGERIMIDVGTRESGEAILSHLAKWNVKALDLVILSHNHDDHAGGLPILEEVMPVGGVLYAGEPPTDCGLEMRELVAGETFTLGEVCFTVLGPLSSEDSDNRSMILRVDYGKRSFLFTGDAEPEEEELLLQSAPTLLDVDLLKVAHHGSKYSTTQGFVEAVSPEIAVFSASAENSFGHPAPSVMERLKEADCLVYRTDLTGTIIFLCDGKQITRYRG